MRKRPPQPRCVVTARDRALFLFLGQHHCASITQLRARYWPDAAYTTCRDRVRVLEQAGLVGRRVVERRGGYDEVVWLEPAGRRLCPEDVRPTLYCGCPPPGEQAHLLATVDVLTRLERRVPVLNWTGARVLKGTARRSREPGGVADLAVTIAPGGRPETLFVEIDGAYHGRVLRRKVAALGASGHPVLWVVLRPRRLPALQTLCQPWPLIRPVLLTAL